jgi:hypothetical protein
MSLYPPPRYHESDSEEEVVEQPPSTEENYQDEKFPTVAFVGFVGCSIAVWALLYALGAR